MRTLGNIGKIPELQKRILFTIAMLAVFRIGAHVPTPGVNAAALVEIFRQAEGTILGLFSTFTGRALQRMSVFALGIMPYISSSIILQLLTQVIPQLERLQKEGEQGRKKITQYTRYGTVVLSVLQSFGIGMWLQNLEVGSTRVVPHPGIGFQMMTVITLTSGTAFIMWLGEQITERGIGNGISLIIFAGIITDIPQAIGQMFEQARAGQGLSLPMILILLAIMVVVVGAIVFMERGQRRIPVQYAKRMVGRKMYQGAKTHLPLKVNTAGVIPPIFASSLLMFPATAAKFLSNRYEWFNTIADMFSPTHAVYSVVYVVLILFFCYFYTAIVFNPVDVADNLKKHGGYIPGQRPGKSTAEYIDRVLTRVTLGGAIYVAVICVLPTLLIGYFGVPFYFGGTGLMIVVGVAMDTIAQIEAHLLTRNYEGFLGPGGPKIRGRRGR